MKALMRRGIVVAVSVVTLAGTAAVGWPSAAGAQDGPSDATINYVVAVYNDFLLREPESEAVVLFWADFVETFGRAAFVDAVMSSSEGREVVAFELGYSPWLERAPDAAGLAFWVAQLGAGLSWEELEAAFASSEEVLSFCVVTEVFDTGCYVELLYNEMLGRAPDEAGFLFWTSQLDSGNMTPAEVALGFTESDEYALLRVAILYEAFLGRLPDAAGWAAWVDAQDIVGLRGVLLGILTSDEYFNNAQLVVLALDATRGWELVAERLAA